MRQGVVDGREYRHPLIQAADPQDLRHLGLRCDEAIAAPGLVGVVGDPDQGAEPTGVAEGQPGEVEEEQPGVAGDGGMAPRGCVVGGGQVQLSCQVQNRDPLAAIGSHLIPPGQEQCVSRYVRSDWHSHLPGLRDEGPGEVGH